MSNNASITRRTFAAGAAAGLLALGATQALADEAASHPIWGPCMEEVTDDMAATVETADAVVVGSGTAGTFAAVRLAELGANVVWLEKTAIKGGTSLVTEGSGAPNSQLQLAVAPESDEFAIYQRIQQWHQWGALPEAIWSHFKNGADGIDWAVSHGAGLTFIGSPEAPGCMCFGPDGKWIPMGEGVLAPLWEFGETLENLDFRLETPAISLAFDAEGKVAGVFAKGPDGQIAKIETKAVILATGGFGCNEAMKERYLSVPTKRVKLLGFEGQDGDGINMALSAGAALHAPSALMYGLGHIIGTKWDDIMNVALVWPFPPMTPVTEPVLPLPVVNERGKRFIAESGIGMSTATPFNIALTGQARTFVVFDEARVALFDGIEEIDYMSGISRGNLRESLAACEYVWSADTIEELASLMGVDAEALAESIATFNAIANGEEATDAFGSMAENMAKLGDGPFYAAEIEACAYSTCGGVKANYDCQALDENGEAIEGLFACGLDNGSLYYNDYPYGVYSGSGQGSATSNGYAAAEAVAKLLG